MGIGRRPKGGSVQPKPLERIDERQIGGNGGTFCGLGGGRFVAFGL